MPKIMDSAAWIPWFQTYPLRLKEEVEELEAIGFTLDSDLLESESRVVFSGCLETYPERNLKLIFPHTYPSLPPRVIDDGLCELLVRHQSAQDRTYCLFGPEGKGWYAGLTGMDALKATRDLLDFMLGGEAKKVSSSDPYPEPYSTQIKLSDLGVVLVPPNIAEALPDKLDQLATGKMRVRFTERGPKSIVSRGIVEEVQFKGKSEKTVCSKNYHGMVSGPVSNGKVIYLPNLDRPIHDGKSFAKFMKELGVSHQGNYGWYALVFPEESGDRLTIRHSWIVFRRTRNSTYSPLRTITYRQSERAVRIPGKELLTEKKVAIIGCGSLGSKIASALAASGVTRFVLVDRDIMEPVNAVRHECGINCFAVPKTHALAGHLTRFEPDLELELYPFDPFSGSTFDDSRKVVQGLGKCDLIVHATGNSCVSRSVNELSKLLGIPSVHVSVTNGAWSGEIVRYVPNRSSCWLCFQESYGDTNPPSEPTPVGRIFGPGCDQPTFTGTTYDLDIVAGLASGFGVDTLKVIEGGVSEYEGDYLLWEGRDSHGKLLHKASVKSFVSRHSCALCGTE